MKHRLISTMSIALLASVGFSLPVLAQNKTALPAETDKMPVVPGKKEMPTNSPTVEKMDDNTQRQHGRGGSAASPGRATNAKAPASGNAGTQTRLPPGEVRDWSAIDKNKDNLISPEEMEAALRESRPANATSK
jgi:hypothetical protein